MTLHTVILVRDVIWKLDGRADYAVRTNGLMCRVKANKDQRLGLFFFVVEIYLRITT